MQGSEEKISVKIGSMSYQIRAKEDAYYMREIARRADEMIRNIRKTNPQLNGPTATVLALVNAVDQLEKLRQGGSVVRQAQDHLKEALEEGMAERLHLREKCWELKKDLLYYRNLCEIYEERLAQLSPNSKQRGKRSKKREEAASFEARQQAFDGLISAAETKEEKRDRQLSMETEPGKESHV